MYGLLIDKSAADSKNLLTYLSSWKQKNSLQTQEYQVSGVDDITTILKENGDKFNTVIAIGNSDSFEMLVAESRYLRPDVVIGYVPTSRDLLSRRFGIRDYKDGFEAISQRKLVELSALSANQHFFLFDYVLNTEINKSQDPVKSIVKIDKSLELKMSAHKLIIHNRNQEVMPHDTALLIEAYSKKISHSESLNILKIPGIRNASKNAEEILQLRLPAHKFIMDSSQTMYSRNGKKIKNPINIGFKKKIIRVIVKRGQEIQNIMSPGLIS